MKTLDDHKREIAALIEKLIAARAEYNRLVYDKEEEEQLGQPATPEQLAALEKRLGKPLPPSYRAFLELHNGWKEFAGEGHLLSTEDQESDWLPVRVQEFQDLFDEFGELSEDDEDEDENEDSGEEDGEEEPPCGPFAEGMLPLVMGKHGRDFVVMDLNSVSEDGEMTIREYELTQRLWSHGSFIEFLRDELNVQLESVESARSGSSEEDED